jgi:D-xylonolactonase
MDRFNDVIADPAGRVFAGTYVERAARAARGLKAGLYRVDTDRTVTRLFQGTGCSNGMGFSPDRRHFYWTDTTARTIFRFVYHEETGEIDDRRALVVVPEGEGVPDGLAVDAEGCLWSARWGGFGIYRHAPDGGFLEKIEFPVEKVSSCVFGGPNLDALYVTTAGGDDKSNTPDGTLYRVKVGVKGQREFRSKIQTAPC